MLRVRLPRVSDKERDHIVDAEEPIPVIQGEDEVPRQPAPPLDPYTPEPGPGPGEERAFKVMRWAWVPLIVVVLLILIALLR
jgi:hypothetical protein